MANPGVGSKFVSVNLNKSYGKSSSLGGGGGRGRPSGHGSMVVLSRPRSLVSAGQRGPRLAVPPPLNLPSLRKEHEKTDPSSSSLIGAAGPGLGSTSSGMGWTKPQPLRSGEGQIGPIFEPGKVASAGVPAAHRVASSGGEDANGRSSVYTPPGARATGLEVPVTPADEFQPVEKAVVLRGEDFPSLKASLPVGQSLLRQKEQQKQKQKQNDAASKEQSQKPSDGLSDFPLSLPMRPQMNPRANAGSSGGNGRSNRKSVVFNDGEQTRKVEGILPGPLPMVRLNHSYDWADDERDTSYRPEHNRDHGFLRNEVHNRERELDASRNVIPLGGSSNGGFDLHSFHKSSSLNALTSDQNGCDTTLLDAGRVALRDAVRRDTYGRDLLGNRNGRDENLWRGLPMRKDGYDAGDTEIDQNDGGYMRPPLTSYIAKDSKIDRGRNLLRTSTKSSAWNGSGVSGNGPIDSRFKEPYNRDFGQKGSQSTEAVGGRGTEQGSQRRQADPSNWLKGSNRVAVQNNITARSPFSFGTKGFPINDPILSLGKDKRLFPHNGKPYVEDAFVKGLTSSTFDGRDPFAHDTRVFKRKKEVLKTADFHDPVRELFEAELERIQKMQEQERQQVLEEQAIALELARKEEEERERLAREEAERRRKLEEEAREAAWRAEQERLEAARRAEEQKRAREEEKRQMLLEEERRKEAARQKLLELEARIARRQADTSKDEVLKANDESLPGSQKDGEHSRMVAAGEWEDSERMVDRLTSSASSESCGFNRSLETGSRPQFSRNSYAIGVERAKHAGSWRRDGHDNGSISTLFMQANNPNCEAVRGFSRRELHGGLGFMPSRGFSKVALQEMRLNDDLSQLKGQRWSFAMDDHYCRNLGKDVEYIENSMEKSVDVGYGQGHTRGGPHVPYTERMLQNSDMDGVSFGRLRHFVRQPRVLPPPSLPSMNKSSLTINVVDRSSSSTFVDHKSEHQLAPHKDAEFLGSDYGGGLHRNHDQSDLTNRLPEDPISMKQNDDKNTLGCDSQSSLSVSSPPNSPTHLSHDDLEDGGDSNASHADYEQTVMSDNDNVVLLSEANDKIVTASPGSVSPGEEDWMVEDNEGSQEQEEYDEVGDAYEEEEVHEGNEGNFDLARDFRDLHLEEKIQSNMLIQPVLDFENDVKDGITEDNDFVESRADFQQISSDFAPDTRLSEASLAGVGQNTNENNNQPKNGSSELQFPLLSSSVHETEKALQDLVLQPVSVSKGQVPYAKHVDDGIKSSDSVLSGQQLRTSVDTSASSAHAVEPILSAVSSVTDVPVHVQFGLFSGPSLMPSPLPAIQIGSIQMPLHLHPQVAPSLSQLHPTQPPMFQFGQLNYPTSITQGVLPIGPQTVSFVQSAVPAHYSVSQQPTVSVHSQPSHESSQRTHSGDKIAKDHLESKQSFKHADLGQENVTNEPTSLPTMDNIESLGDKPHSHAGDSFFDVNNLRSGLLSNMGDQVNKDVVKKKIHRATNNNRVSQDQIHGKTFSSNAFSGERATSRAPTLGTASSGGTGMVVCNDRNASAILPLPVPEAPRVEHNSFKKRGQRTIRRTEFRVRENVDRRQTDASASSVYAGQEVSASSVRVVSTFSKGGGRKDFVAQKATNSMPSVRSETIAGSGYAGYRAIDSEGKLGKTLGSEALSNRHSTEKGPRSADRNLKRNIAQEEYVDTSLQSGVVRVFNQPGIETPSDEDDFIEVRSKRQMLNDRREQREKEIKAKSRAAKVSRKPRSISKSDARLLSASKTPLSLVADGVLSATNGLHAEPAILDGSDVTQNNGDRPLPITSAVASHHLPPIGIPRLHNDAEPDTRPLNTKSLQASTFPMMSGRGGNLVPALSFENNNAVLNDISSSFGAWGNVHVNHHVMALTQNQLDEALKPAGFETRMSPTVDHSSLVLETTKGATSIMAQDKSFTASANSLNSLLAGEKIHFGAVTSPTVLPPTSSSVLKGVGPPVSCISDASIEHKVPATEDNHMMLFDKVTHSEKSCVQLEDPEAVGEAAASAVAVAAISSDEPVGNVLGAGSATVADATNYGVDVSALPVGAIMGTLPLSSQPRSEESLHVSLPADLSVETPSLSLWPPLPSPQSSSSQMLSHFPGAPHSHFPCFEMNPMLGGPIFTFGPHDESSNSQLQAQKSNTSGSGSLGPWQQCHSGVDSFYGPPAGFSGPFIGPPGPIPGVQGPPHMVVYNHFASVGQFGQMGLRLMGTAYIPSGKQPDWKHIPAASTSVGHNDSSINSLNMVPGQCDPGIPMPIQHLGPGSPLVPIASPLGMFDMSPFQPSADLAVQSRWSHIPAPPLHSFAPPMSGIPMPSQQAEVPPQQFNHAASVESNGSRFDEGGPSNPPDSSTTISTNDPASQFPDELGLGDASSGSPLPTSRSNSYGTVNIKVQSSGQHSSRSPAGNFGDTSNTNSATPHLSQSSNSTFKTPPAQPQIVSTHQHVNPIGYTEQKGRGATQKVSFGNEWPRRPGFTGRNHAGGVEKSCSAKMKQIYVAKQASSDTSML